MNTNTEHRIWWNFYQFLFPSQFKMPTACERHFLFIFSMWCGNEIVKEKKTTDEKNIYRRETHVTTIVSSIAILCHYFNIGSWLMIWLVFTRLHFGRAPLGFVIVVVCFFFFLFLFLALQTPNKPKFGHDNESLRCVGVSLFPSISPQLHLASCVCNRLRGLSAAAISCVFSFSFLLLLKKFLSSSNRGDYMIILLQINEDDGELKN